MVKQVGPVFTFLQLPLADAQDAQTMSVYNLRNATGCGILTRNPNLPVPIIERTWLVRDPWLYCQCCFICLPDPYFLLIWETFKPTYLSTFFLSPCTPSLPSSLNLGLQPWASWAGTSLLSYSPKSPASSDTLYVPSTACLFLLPCSCLEWLQFINLLVVSDWTQALLTTGLILLGSAA